MEMTVNDKLIFNENFFLKDLYSPVFGSTGSQWLLTKDLNRRLLKSSLL